MLEYVNDLVPFAQLFLPDGFALHHRLVGFDFDELDAFSANLGPPSCVDAVWPGVIAVFPPVCADEGTTIDDEA